ncbi:MAG: ABC transporter ATP-binding protein [Burkholderiales bacterium]|nr:MAG: ABC transporter ATP-binding protein [Burkholderiales bacterium]
MSSALLQVKNLSARLGAAQLLFGIDFEAHAGEVVVLVGRNGAGKSTTLKAIMGLASEVSGTVMFSGQSIAGLEPHTIARLGLGYVPEERRIFTGLTVAENLEVGRIPSRSDTADAPRWSVDRVCELFPKLKEMLDRPGGQMSGGEQQMLTIARTLMGNPRAILLDEPSEGLAPIVVERIAESIQRLKRDGLCIVLSEQNTHFARAVADRAIVIERGCVTHAGGIELLEPTHP